MNWYKKAVSLDGLEDSMLSDNQDQYAKEQDLDCPECGAKLRFIPQGKFGPYYRCEQNCGVTHGAWDDGRPKGVPGDLETMKLRKAAHNKFDQMWKNEADPKEARSKAYEWLSRKIGCHKNQCHMALFDKEQLRRVIGICEFALQQKRKNELGKNIQPELF